MGSHVVFVSKKLSSGRWSEWRVDRIAYIPTLKVLLRDLRAEGYFGEGCDVEVGDPQSDGSINVTVSWTEDDIDTYRYAIRKVLGGCPK